MSIHWAADFELGAIAQLGERRAGSAKAVGSSPTSSTSEATAAAVASLVQEPPRTFVQAGATFAPPADYPDQMRALILIACAVLLGYMALFQTDGLPHTYAAVGAAGCLLLALSGGQSASPGGKTPASDAG